jgi:hypothetical protein
MESIVVASACISALESEYTSDWYLPIKNSSEAIIPLLDHKIKKNYPNIFFKIMDFPFCSVGRIHQDILNNATLPNLGDSKVDEKHRSSIDDQIPHYRIKKHFKECSDCMASSICSGIYKNDLDMFGKGNLKAITLDTLTNPNYQKFKEVL